jgi:hypothetical protein
MCRQPVILIIHDKERIRVRIRGSAPLNNGCRSFSSGFQDAVKINNQFVSSIYTAKLLMIILAYRSTVIYFMPRTYAPLHSLIRELETTVQCYSVEEGPF